MNNKKIGSLVIATILTFNIAACSLQKESLKGNIINKDQIILDDEVNKYKDRIEIFIKKTEETIPEIDTSDFYENIKTLTIIDNTKLEKSKIGSYNIDDNTITLANDNDGSLEHELTHLLFADRKINKRGIVEDEKNYGTSLSEGFTELISSEINNQETTYRFETGLAKILITIIGKEKIIEAFNKKDINIIEQELSNIKPEISDGKDFIKYCDVYNILLMKMHNEFFNTGSIEQFKKTNEYTDLTNMKRLVVGRIKIYIKSYFKNHINDVNYEETMINIINLLDIVDKDLFNPDIDTSRENDFFLKDEVTYLVNKHKIDDDTYNSFVNKARTKQYFVNNGDNKENKNIK